MAIGAKASDGSPIPGADARIVLGGKVSGWSGILPGVAEEVLCMLEAGKPVYVLGCFGGAAQRIGQALLGNEYPPELLKPFHDNEVRFGRTCAAYAEHGKGGLIEARFKELRERLLGAASTDNDDRWVNNGLKPKENHKLLETENFSLIKKLLRKGLENVFGKAPADRGTT